MINVLKSNLAFRVLNTTSLVILEFTISIVEYKGKYFVGVIKGMSPNPEFIIKHCETQLEAGLIWRNVYEAAKKNFQNTWFRAITGFNKHEEELYIKAMDDLILEEREITLCGMLGNDGYVCKAMNL